jgi:hypothetical protein
MMLFGVSMAFSLSGGYATLLSCYGNTARRQAGGTPGLLCRSSAQEYGEIPFASLGGLLQ